MPATRQDMYNVARDFDVNSIVHKDDAREVEYYTSLQASRQKNGAISIH